MLQRLGDGRIKLDELNTSKIVINFRLIQIEPSKCPKGTMSIREIKREVVERFGSVSNYLSKYPHPFLDHHRQEQRVTQLDFGGKAGCSSHTLN